MLLFTSKLTYTGHILWCSTSSPSVSQSPSPTLCSSSWPYREERLSLIGMARSCMDCQVHRSRFTGSSWGCRWKQMPTRRQKFLWQKMRDGKRGPRLSLELWAELAGYHFKKRHPLFLSSSLLKTLHNPEREWSNTDWVSGWKQRFEKPQCCQILSWNESLGLPRLNADSGNLCLFVRTEFFAFSFVCFWGWVKRLNWSACLPELSLKSTKPPPPPS